MTPILPETLAKLDALNHWLEEIYGERIHISQLLRQSGLSEDQINSLKLCCLSSYIDEVILYIGNISDGHDAERRHEAMLRFYGLNNGNAETLQKIADDFNVTRERIRQIKDKRLQLFKRKNRKAALENELMSIAHRLLANLQV